MDAEQLSRIESLGDNCELGFVLRRLGCDAGSLFRWASMSPERLLGMLRADLSGVYQFDNLEPLRLSMVLDKPFGVGWHTEMTARPGETGLVFRDDERTRRSVHRREKRKLTYLIAKFRSRARHGGIVFVVKANAGIPADLVEALHAELARFCGGAPFTLLEVAQASDPAEIGTVIERRAGLLKGFVRAFAPYERADDSDTEVWTSILARALALSPCPDWDARLSAAQGAIPDTAIMLPFPAAGQTDEARVQLIGGNEWCRRVDSGFRVHGAQPNQPATLLRWSTLALPGLHHLSGTIRSAVSDAAPVSVTVRVRNSTLTDVRERRSIVTPEAPWVMDLAIDPDDPADMVLEIAVDAARVLETGERAVVDVSALALHPAG